LAAKKPAAHAEQLGDAKDGAAFPLSQSGKNLYCNNKKCRIKTIPSQDGCPVWPWAEPGSHFEQFVAAFQQIKRKKYERQVSAFQLSRSIAKNIFVKQTLFEA